MTRRFTFFWTAESPFSQWHLSDFTVDGQPFCTAEQYMMYGKAQLFSDDDIAAKILATGSPKQQKALGRKVRGFDERRWRDAREDIVYRGNLAKFTQNEPLRRALLGTGDTVLVEASPVDRIWGVGLAETDPRIHNEATWRGLNLLGKVLTRLRDDLRSAAAATG